MVYREIAAKHKKHSLIKNNINSNLKKEGRIKKKKNKKVWKSVDLKLRRCIIRSLVLIDGNENKPSSLKAWSNTICVGALVISGSQLIDGNIDTVLVTL